MIDLCRVRFTTNSGDECCFEGIFLAANGIASIYQIVGGFQSSQMLIEADSADPAGTGPYLIVWRRIDRLASGTDLNSVGDEEIWARVFPGVTHLVEFLKTSAADTATQQLDLVDYAQLLELVQTAIADNNS